MNSFFTLDDCLVIKRKSNLTKTGYEALVHFRSKPHNFKRIMEEIQNQWLCTKIYVYADSKYDVKGTYFFNLYFYQTQSTEKFFYENSLPQFELTRKPDAIPVTLRETTDWTQVENISILPFNGWDFYELEWILQRWESSLSIFDFDEFWILPSYPKDVYNNIVHPDIILYTIDSYIEKHSLKDLEINFFALYLFCKDNLGKEILKLFYKYHDKKIPIERVILYKDLHKLYHETEKTHEYRPYLFFQNYSLSNRDKFRMNLFILQYFSFYGMFICDYFIEQRKKFLFSGIQANFPELLRFFPNQNVLQENLSKAVSNHFQKNLTWIGRNHVKELAQKNKEDYWNYIDCHWNYYPRNVCLFDIKISCYDDQQLKLGVSTKKLFLKEWVMNFDNENYKPKISILRRKRKL